MSREWLSDVHCMPKITLIIGMGIGILAGVLPIVAQTAQLKTADAVLERYKGVLGGVEAIKNVQSETVPGEICLNCLQR